MLIFLNPFSQNMWPILCTDLNCPQGGHLGQGVTSDKVDEVALGNIGLGPPDLALHDELQSKFYGT